MCYRAGSGGEPGHVLGSRTGPSLVPASEAPPPFRPPRRPLRSGLRGARSVPASEAPAPFRPPKRPLRSGLRGARSVPASEAPPPCRPSRRPPRPGRGPAHLAPPRTHAALPGRRHGAMVPCPGSSVSTEGAEAPPWRGATTRNSTAMGHPRRRRGSRSNAARVDVTACAAFRERPSCGNAADGRRTRSRGGHQHMSCIVGVDFAAQDKNFGLALGRLRGDGLLLE